MEDFIKRYSDVPIGFIDDFFNIAKIEYNHNELIINFDIVVKWLDVRKENLKRLLVGNFENNYDYVITKYNQKNVNTIRN